MIIAHGWHLALLDKPLLIQRPERWDGYIQLPDIIYAFKHLGRLPIMSLIYDSDGKIYDDGFSEDSRVVMYRVYEKYGYWGEDQLIYIVSKIRDCSDDGMRFHYRQIMEDNRVRV